MFVYSVGTNKVTFILVEAMKAQAEINVWLYSFLTSALDTFVGQHLALAALSPENDPVPIVQEVGWVSGPGWIGSENLAHTGISSPDKPARHDSL